MDILFAAFGTFTLVACGAICFHLLTDEDDCTHPNVGQYDGECDCGERIEIGGSE